MQQKLTRKNKNKPKQKTSSPTVWLHIQYTPTLPPNQTFPNFTDVQKYQCTAEKTIQTRQSPLRGFNNSSQTHSKDLLYMKHFADA